MNSDFKDLLLALENYETDYLIVGGYAVMAYTEPRYTKDLDVWVRAEVTNGIRVQEPGRLWGASPRRHGPRFRNGRHGFSNRDRSGTS